MHTSSALPYGGSDRDSLGQRPPRQRPPGQRPLGQRPPSGQRSPCHVTCGACRDKDPYEQNDWQTGVKTLPCLDFVAGGNKSLKVWCLRPLQAWTTNSLGSPLKLSTSLRSPTMSSVIQALFLFLSRRWPLSLPWHITVRAKQLLSLWVSSVIMNFLILRISWKVSRISISLMQIRILYSFNIDFTSNIGAVKKSRTESVDGQ